MQNSTLVHFEQKSKKASDSYKEHINWHKKRGDKLCQNILDKEYKHD